MPTNLLDRPVVSDSSVDEDVIFRLDKEELLRQSELFYKIYCAPSAQKAAVVGAAVAVSGVALSAGGAFANPSTGGGASNAAEAAAASIAAGVTNAINTIEAIDGIGLAAFGVALAPMGFMVTLRVLNMVLSRV